MNKELHDEVELGKVDMSSMSNRSVKKVSEEEFDKITSAKVGMIDIPLESLPTKGRFYPASMKIKIRPAKTSEIKDFSIMDETNPLEINDKLNNMLNFCTEIIRMDKKGSFKDLTEDDKMFVILSIREATFPKGESNIKLKAVCSNCEHENQFVLRTENIQYYEENDKLKNYYDDVERCYCVKTKNHGIIKMSPPRIGVMQEITDYARKKQEQKQKWDKANIQILPYLNLEWRGLNEKGIFDKFIEFEGWDKDKYPVVLRLTEMMRSGIKQTLKYECASCSKEIDVNVEIEGGMKSLFVKYDIDDELI